MRYDFPWPNVMYSDSLFYWINSPKPKDIQLTLILTKKYFSVD